MIYHRIINRIILLLLILTTSYYGTDAMAIEKAKYQIVESELDVEIRKYAPQIVAETFVEGEFEKVGNEGFRRLYDYISGNNRKNQNISMTAPVTQEGKSEKIAMTAPVNQARENGKWRITFLMPAEYSLVELPQPLDERVMLREDPARLVAAIRYSGTWSESRYNDKKSVLENFIARRGLKVVGEAIWARYDPPFMPWFLRRNEVLIPVEIE